VFLNTTSWLIRVFKHYELVDQSIYGGIAKARHDLDLRQQKEALRFINKIKKLRRNAKHVEESKKNQYTGL